jgi:hypothetical protein
MKSISIMNTPIPQRTLLASMLLCYAGLIVWLGGLLFFGVGVAMIIFKQLPSKDLAGALNAVILHRLNMMELAGAVLLGVSLVLLVSNVGLQRLRVPIGILCAMLVLWIIYAFSLTSAMNSLRLSINSFDTPRGASLALVEQFRGLHSWYSRLVSANMVLGIVLFVLQTRLFVGLAASVEKSFSNKF